MMCRFSPQIEAQTTGSQPSNCTAYAACSLATPPTRILNNSFLLKDDADTLVAHVYVYLSRERDELGLYASRRHL